MDILALSLTAIAICQKDSRIFYTTLNNIDHAFYARSKKILHDGTTRLENLHNVENELVKNCTIYENKIIVTFVFN